MVKPKRIFVCSPLRGATLAEREANERRAEVACAYVAEQGHAPFAPHLLYPRFLDDGLEGDRELGLAAAKAWLEVADEVWVFGKRVSDGMRGEIEYAEGLGKLVVHIVGPRWERRPTWASPWPEGSGGGKIFVGPAVIVERRIMFNVPGKPLAEIHGLGVKLYDPTQELLEDIHRPCDGEDPADVVASAVELLDPDGRLMVRAPLSVVPVEIPLEVVPWGKIMGTERTNQLPYYDLTMPEMATVSDPTSASGFGPRHTGRRIGWPTDGRPWCLVAHFAREHPTCGIGFWIYGVPRP